MPSIENLGQRLLDATQESFNKGSVAPFALNRFTAGMIYYTDASDIFKVDRKTRIETKKRIEELMRDYSENIYCHRTLVADGIHVVIFSQDLLPRRINGTPFILNIIAGGSFSSHVSDDLNGFARIISFPIDENTAKSVKYFLDRSSSHTSATKRHFPEDKWEGMIESLIDLRLELEKAGLPLFPSLSRSSLRSSAAYLPMPSEQKAYRKWFSMESKRLMEWFDSR